MKEVQQYLSVEQRLYLEDSNASEVFKQEIEIKEVFKAGCRLYNCNGSVSLATEGKVLKIRVGKRKEKGKEK